MEHKNLRTVASGVFAGILAFFWAITSGATSSSLGPTAIVSPWGGSPGASQAQGFCLDDAGNAYVLEASLVAGSITKVSPSNSVTPIDANDGALANATALACATSSPTLYVGFTNGDVSQIPMSGGSLLSYSTGNSFQVGGIVASSGGTLYVAASNEAALYQVAPGGGAAVALGASGLASNGLHAMVLEGNALYVASATTNQLFRVSLSGGAAEQITTEPLNEPTGMALDPGGNLWIANINTNDFVVVEAGLGTSVSVRPTGTLLQGPGGLAWNGTNFVTENINQSNQPFVQIAITNVPTAPSSLISTSSSPHSLTVSWAPPTWTGNSPLLAYRVTAQPGGASCQSASTSCTVTGLSASTVYSIVVQAVNSAGTGPISSPLTLATQHDVLVATGIDLKGSLLVASVSIGIGSAGLVFLRRRERRVL